MKLLLLRSVLTTGTCLLLQAASLHANIEFTTFDPGYAYQDQTSESIGIEGSAQEFGSLAVADEFTAGFTGTLTSVVVAAFGGYPVEVELFQNDPATNLPLVSSEVLLGELTTPTASGSVETFTLAADGPTLSAGDTYWLGLAPSSPATADGWNRADNISATKDAFSGDGGATYYSDPYYASAFEIDAVPEPSTWALIPAGAGLLYASRQRHSRTS